MLRWRLRAACIDADPALFFPEQGDHTGEARAICAACPVRAECLQYALQIRADYGVWGGLNRDERRTLRRAARLTAAVA